MTLGNDWLQAAWTQTWQVTVLIVAVALLVRLAAANRPQLAFVLWLVVLVKCVTPPLWSSPSGAFCWLQPPRVCADAVDGDGGGCRENVPHPVEICSDNHLRPPRARHAIVVGTTSEDILECGDSSPLSAKRSELPRHAAAQKKSGDESPHSKGVQTRRPGQSTAAAPAATMPVVVDESVRSSLATPQPATLLMSFWLTGMIAVFGLIVWRRVRFAKLLRRASRVENPTCERILASLRHRLRLRGSVRLIVTERLVGPAVLGLIRPTVLLPQAVIEGKSVEELELILAHELIHVRRGDLWFGLLRSVVELLWWFHPLVWWAARRASREAERCCDEAVLAELQCGPASYARCLLDVLEAKHQLRSVPACPGVRAIEITQGRLERIMKIGQRGYRRTLWWCWAIAIVAAAAVVPGAAIGTPADKTDTSALPLGEGTKESAAPPKKKAKKAAAPTLTPPMYDDIDRMLKRKPTAPAFAADPPAKDSPTFALPRAVDARMPSAAPTLAPPLDEYRRTSRIVPSRPLDAHADPTPASPRYSRYDSTSAPLYAPQASENQIERMGVATNGVYENGVLSYHVADVLSRIRAEQQLDDQKSRDFLKGLLKSSVVQNELGTSVRYCTVGKSKPSPTPVDIIWNSVDVIVETTAQGHRRIAEALELIRKYGTAEIKIEVRFASGPADELKKAMLNWTVLPSELPVSAAPNCDGGPNMPSPFDRSFDNERGPRRIRSQFVIEKISPMMYGILDEAADAKFVKQWEANQQANILHAPRVTTFNGHSVFVSDSSQTPFVVAVVDGQPQIRIVHEGTIMQLRPLADAHDKLKLDFRVEFSKIRGVETANLSAVSEGKPVTIQIPEVEKMCVEGGLDLPWNKWLLLRGLERKPDKGNSPYVLIVMVRAEKVLRVQQPADGSGRQAITAR